VLELDCVGTERRALVAVLVSVQVAHDDDDDDDTGKQQLVSVQIKRRITKHHVEHLPTSLAERRFTQTSNALLLLYICLFLWTRISYGDRSFFVHGPVFCTVWPRHLRSMDVLAESQWRH